MSVTQIAAKAGVSIATVSRVLNNNRRVNPDIAEQVRRAVTELRYVPRPGRRKRRRAREAAPQRRTIAVVSLALPYRQWFNMPVIASVVGQISRVAQADHCDFLMAEMPDPDKLSPVLRQQRVDGAIVFIPGHVDPSVAGALAQRCPIVRVMGGQFGPVPIDHVAPDNDAVGHLAAQYLLGLGCRSLAYVTTAPNWEFIKLRHQGFSAAAEAGGAASTALLIGECGNPPPHVYGPGARSLATPEELADEFAARRPDGVFISRDEEAVQLYRLLHARGIVPGRDFKLISCDNESVRLSTLHPRPASIEVGTAEIARRAVRRLNARMRKPDEPPVRILVSPRLMAAVDNPHSPGAGR